MEADKQGQELHWKRLRTERAWPAADAAGRGTPSPGEETDTASARTPSTCCAENTADATAERPFISTRGEALAGARAQVASAF